jgi:hypothetical protein
MSLHGITGENAHRLEFIQLIPGSDERGLTQGNQKMKLIADTSIKC